MTGVQTCALPISPPNDVILLSLIDSFADVPVAAEAGNIAMSMPILSPANVLSLILTLSPKPSANNHQKNSLRSMLVENKPLALMFAGFKIRTARPSGLCVLNKHPNKRNFFNPCV